VVIITEVWPEDLYATHRLSNERVNHYKFIMNANTSVDLIKIRLVDKKYVIIDGAHRAYAAMMLGKSIKADVLREESELLTDEDIRNMDLLELRYM
jgi:uncharacterized protein (DUF1015 family)